MLNEMIKEMEESARAIIRSHVLTVFEDYRVGSITLDETAESIGVLARMEKRCALIAAAVCKMLASERGDLQ